MEKLDTFHCPSNLRKPIRVDDELAIAFEPDPSNPLQV